jgi:hypothetical protein
VSDDHHHVTNDPAEADIVVCARYTAPQQLILADNMLGECSDCGHPIQFRPFVADAPRKICVPCVINLARKH